MHYYQNEVCILFTAQADPFGMFAVSCKVSNRADFMVENIAEDISVVFIEELDTGGDS